MITYLQRLLDERDRLTQTAQSISDEAAKRNEDLTETEKTTLSGIAERCAVIDGQITTYNQQAESNRAYAALRVKMQNVEADAEAEHKARQERSAAQQQQQNAGQLKQRDTSWAAPFMRSGVLQSYTGHGTTSKVEIGPAWQVRGDPEPPGNGNGANVITTDTPPEGVLRPMRWTGNATPTWAPRLLALVNTVPVTTGAVDWVRYQPHPPSAAQVVAEGEAKPEAEISLEIESALLKTYAHWKAITRQALEDIPAVQAEIENRLRAGILFALQDGIADAIDTETNFPTATGPDLLSAIRMGLGEMDDANGYTPNGVLLNPADWAAIDLQVLAATQNLAANNNPWGLTFAASRKIDEGTAYVGDFRAALTLFQRNATSVYLTDSHEGMFIKNILVLLAETRAFAAVTEPMAMVKVTATSTRSAPAPRRAAAPQPATAGK